MRPNPMVGAVVVRGGEIVGEGWHGEWGGPHAEVEALRAAGDRARGATLYVNLEPCHHHGKTSPCTDAIVEAGVGRVVYALEDPNPQAGGGAAWLREQGVRVAGGVCEEEARELNAPHLVSHRLGRPFMALKYAISVDGRLSEGPDTPTPVTGPEAIREAHRLRAGHDAVMVGIGTVLADDPLLTVREWEPPERPGVRIVLDSDLRIAAGSRLVETADQVPVWVVAAAGASESRARELEDAGVLVIRAERAESDGLRPGSVLAQLWDRDLQSILCEGGGTLGSALLASGTVDRLYLFVAPRLFGWPGVRAFTGPRGQAPRDWRLLERRALGEDTLLVLSSGLPGTGA